MGNTRSSSGCALCRRRKIKVWDKSDAAYRANKRTQCDEGRPGCKRCAQIRKTCPGYPYQIRFDLLVPPEDGQSQVNVKRESGFVSPSGISTSGVDNPTSLCKSLEGDDNIKQEEQDGDSLSIAASQLRPESPPKYNIRHQSICFFMNLFCWQAERLYSFPVLDFLPHVLSTASEQSPIHVAATAVSRMALADQYSGKDPRLLSVKEYTAALTLSQKAILDPNASTRDDTVVAVWLLGLYEAINSVLYHGRTDGAKVSAEDEVKAHVKHLRGAMYLLHKRGASQFDNAYSEKIFRIFKAAIQMRLFTLTTVTSEGFGRYELEMYTDEYEFVPSETAMRATKFFLHVAQWMETVKAFLVKERRIKQKPSTVQRTQQLIQDAESLDHTMEDWSEHEPGWQMMEVRGSPNGTTWALYPNHARYYFYSFWVYLYWIRYLIARVKLYEALIVLVRCHPDNCDPTGPEIVSEQAGPYIKTIHSTAWKIIGLTAYAIGDVSNTGTFKSPPSTCNPGDVAREMNVIAAMQLVLPLKTFSRLPYTTQEQKGAIDLSIVHIGDGFRRTP